MFKSFVVSLAVILFVSSVVFRNLAHSEALQCIALFNDEKIVSTIDQTKKSPGAPTSPILMTLNERLSAMASEGKSSDKNAEMTLKVLRFAESLYVRYGQRLDQLPSNDPHTKMVRHLVKLYMDQLLPLQQSFEANRVELQSTREFEMTKLFVEDQARLISEINRIVSESNIRHSLYAVSQRVGNKAVVEIHGLADSISRLTTMYSRYAQKNGWKVEILHSDDTTILLSIDGTHALTMLALESGKHRFDTSKTSHNEATVQIYKPVEEGHIDESTVARDIVFTPILASGAGGQHIQKNETAVRAVHKPTGIQVKVQVERSQEANKKLAIAIIYGKLKDLADQQHRAELQAARAHAADGRSSQRSPFIRTYRLDINQQIALNLFEGNIDPVLNAQLFKAQIDQIDQLIQLLETGKLFR